MIKSMMILLLLQGSFLLAETFNVVGEKSSVTFEVRHMLFTKTKGAFQNFSGRYTLEGEKLLSLEGEVVVDSLTTKDEKRDSYLKSEKFFDTSTYPTMQLKLLDENRAKLTIKGVSREIPIALTWQEQGFILHSDISRKAFGLKFGALAEVGSIAVGDKVTIKVKIIGSSTAQ